MPIINMLPGGGGTRIPLEPVTNFALVPMDGHVLVSWTDPVDKVATPGGELAAEWKFTKVIRKEGSYPTSSIDGTIVVKSDIRNQYSENAYIDSGLSNGTTYYYAVYAYTSVGAESEPVKGTAEPTDATPEWIEDFTPSINHNMGYGFGKTKDHYILVGGTTNFDYGGTINSLISSIEKDTYTEKSIGNLEPGGGCYEKVFANLGEDAIFCYGNANYAWTDSYSIIPITPELTYRGAKWSKLSSGRGGKIEAVGDCVLGFRNSRYEKITKDYTVTQENTLGIAGPLYPSTGVAKNKMILLSGYKNTGSYPSGYNGYSITEESTVSSLNLSSVSSKIGVDKACCSFKDHAVFAGGDVSGNGINTVFSIDEFLTINILESLAHAVKGPFSAVFDNFIVFSGGKESNNVVKLSEYYDNSFTKRGSFENQMEIMVSQMKMIYVNSVTIDATSMISYSVYSTKIKRMRVQ